MGKVISITGSARQDLPSLMKQAIAENDHRLQRELPLWQCRAIFAEKYLAKAEADMARHRGLPRWRRVLAALLSPAGRALP